ncbi:hypothetical protein L3Y34_019311 [Caenorhabditis briggsae]|uniref:Uncharacterized protein n=1 Tax=Caenorhabditis briggsae TaxID=6238 RepID=A0AAE9IWJ5_CAEBR|nr:hypothetical protein L3Y34_019311 [Caenorhabditis briggsae]
MEDLQEQHRQEKETMTAEFSKIQAAMGTELTQKEELILELTSKVQGSETNIHSIRKGYEMKMAELQEELKNQKALLEEQRDLEAHRNKEAEKERSSMEQTIKDISTELESLRKEQRSVQMLEEQLEHAACQQRKTIRLPKDSQHLLLCELLGSNPINHFQNLCLFDSQCILVTMLSAWCLTQWMGVQQVSIQIVFFNFSKTYMKLAHQQFVLFVDKSAKSSKGSKQVTHLVHEYQFFFISSFESPLPS